MKAQDPTITALRKDVPTELGRISAIGFIIVIVFIGGFFAWAATAPLGGAVVAPGTVSDGGENQMIQHLEGGIISRVLVEEGERVKAGDVLIVLDGTSAKVNRNRFVKQLIALKARAVRLEAERDQRSSYEPGESLLALARAEDAETVVDEQRQEFAARRERFQTEQRILKQRVNSLAESITGLRAQVDAGERQLRVVEEERVRKQNLLEDGLAVRSAYTDLLRSEAALTGQNSNLVASLASMKIQQLEAEEQIVRSRSQAVESAASDLNNVRVQISDVEEQVRQAEDVLRRVEIEAPTDGIIVQILRRTPGSVVRAGESLVEILPENENLVVEARVTPEDKDAIRVGQEAQLHFVSLNRRTTPEVDAIVHYISADRLVDPVTSLPYFDVKLRIDENLPQGIKRDQIFPGMPVEVFLSTQSRTFVEYLIQPIWDSINRSFNEE